MAVRGFARYLAGIDPRTEVPPPGLVRIPRARRAPFIYSDADVLALMGAARRSLREPLRAATYETLSGCWPQPACGSGRRCASTATTSTSPTGSC